jgi:hypothetical protein
MSKGADVGRLRAAFLGAAILAAPFMALLFRTEAGLIVMAVALCAGSFLLADALRVTHGQFHRWLRFGIGVNLALAIACIALAILLMVR